MTPLEKIKAITLDPRDWSWEDTAKAIQDIHEIACNGVKEAANSRNEAIDDCIAVAQLLTKDQCSDHHPSWGACNICGQMDTPEIIDPEQLVSELQKLKQSV